MKYTVIRKYTVIISDIKIAMDEAYGIFETLEEAETFALEKAKTVNEYETWEAVPLHVEFIDL